MSLHAPPQFAKLNTGKRLRIARPAIASLGVALLMSASVMGQTPTVNPRVVAAHGLPDPLDPNNLGEPVWETWIAAGNTEVIVVYQQEIDASNPNSSRIGYAVYDRLAQGPNWSETGIIAGGNDIEGIADPSIAWTGQETKRFIACAGVRRASDGKIAVGVARFNGGEWDDWEGLTEFTGSAGTYPYHKPWILAADSYETGRELYITYWRRVGVSGNYHQYLRSRDGGETWVGGDITDGLGGDTIEMSATMQPAVAGDGPLYLAYRGLSTGQASRETRFLEGIDIDIPNDPHDGEVEFGHLQARILCAYPERDDLDPVDLLIVRNRTFSEVQACLPGGPDPNSNCADVIAIQTIPFLAADPTDPNNLYLVYHDTETADPADKDLNIHLHAMRRYPDGWCPGLRVRVNDDNTQYESDQFLPQVAVDQYGGIHVIWYDDREYNRDSDQADGCDPDHGTSNPRFDVYYAYSDSGGASFYPNEELWKSPDETCLDYSLFDEGPGFEFTDRPGEYNGIVAFEDEVWTSFTGTSQDELDEDPNSNPSVIWSSLIQLD